METQERQNLTDKQRIMIKIGPSSLTHVEAGEVNLMKIEKLVRVISGLRRRGRDTVLMPSKAIATGRQVLGHHGKLDTLAGEQAPAAVSQTGLVMIYQKLFTKYNQTAVQILLIKDTVVNDSSRYDTQNTSDELLDLGTIPIVNENDTVPTSEIPCVGSFGNNGRLPVIVVALIKIDLLILLSDIDGPYTDNPGENPEVGLISLMPEITPESLHMDKNTSDSDVGTGGMSAKLAVTRIATDSEADTVIANGDQADVILGIMSGREKGTLFLTYTNLDSGLIRYLNNEY